MKLEFPYKENDTITIYEDWENNSKVLGTAKLVKLISLGRSFILEDTYPEESQIVYNYQEWLVEWPMPNNFTRRSKQKIRFVDTVGIANSTEDAEEIESRKKLPEDTFLTINSIEIY